MGDLAVQGRAAERRPIEHVPSLPPLVGDYEARRRTFSWEGARAWLQGDAEGHLNIAHEAVDRHAAGARGGKVALRWLGKRGQPSTSPTASCRRDDAASRTPPRARRPPGERVFALRPHPELYIAGLGTLKAGARLLPAVLGLRSRAGRVAAAPRPRPGPRDTEALYRTQGRGPARRAARPRARPAREAAGAPVGRAAVIDLRAARGGVARHLRHRAHRPGRLALLHFTSGTTGKPKGAVHVHGAVVAHHVTGRVRPRSAPRRRLLVHRRSRLGHRHVIRHHRARSRTA